MPTFWLIRSELHNFADNSTISATYKRLQQLIDTLEQYSESVVLWFTQNETILNPKNLRSLLRKRSLKQKLT